MTVIISKILDAKSFQNNLDTKSLNYQRLLNYKDTKSLNYPSQNISPH